MRPRASDEVAVDVSDAPSTSGGDGDLGFWQLLSGREIARPTHPAKGGVRSRVVLLHGWLMSHACWLNTATQLRDRYGHDVLLLDFPGHGRSPLLPEFTDHHPLAFAHRLRAVLRRVGWAPRGGRTAPRLRSIRSIQNSGSRRKPRLKILWFCAVCPWAALCPACTRTRIRAKCRARRAGRVARLDEKWYAPPNLSRPLRVSALHLASLCARAAGASAGGWCPRVRPRTPRCRTCTRARHADVRRAAHMPARLRRAGVPTALCGARWTSSTPRRSGAGRRAGRTPATRGSRGNTPNTPKAKSSNPTMNGARRRRTRRLSAAGKKDAGVHILVHPYFDHFAACVFPDALR